MHLTPERMQRATGCTWAAARRFALPITDATDRYGIDTPERLAAFLAQTGHESQGFERTRENLNYGVPGLLATWPSRYDEALARQHANRPELIANHVYGQRLGNIAPGDGFKYCGRGLIQLTGRANYAAIRDELIERLGRPVPDFVAEPGAVAEPKWAALTAAAFWHARHLNDYADARRFTDLTRRINSGLLGLADRKARYGRALRELERA